MAAGRQIVPHPCCRQPKYVLDKLVVFHLERGASFEQLQACLDAAANQLPRSAYRREGEGLHARLSILASPCRPGVKPLRALLAELLVKRLGVRLEFTPEA